MRPRLVLLALALLAPRVAAQEEEDTSHSQIFVESDSVAPYFARAKSLENSEDYRGLFNLFQGVLAKYSDRVWELEPGRYVGVRQHILRRMRDYPPAAIAMYREMQEPEAEVLWQKHVEKGNEGELQTLVDRYAMTRRGEEASRLLAALSSLRGDPSQSLSLWGQIAADAAATPAERARAILRVALLAQRGGLADRVEWASSQVTRELAATPVSIGGRDVSLAEAITLVKATPPVKRTVTCAEDWPSPGGTPTNDAIGTGSAENNVVAWTWPPSQGPIAEGQGPPMNVAFAPAIANGVLYYSDGQTVVALEVATGKLLWKSVMSHLEHAEDFLTHLARFASTRQEVALGCTVEGDVVYACNVTPPEDNGGQNGSSFLTAFEISKQGKSHFTPGRDGFPKGGVATSPPLVRDDRVYIPCVVPGQGQEPQAYVACLSATTGRPVWPKPIFVCGAMAYGANSEQAAGGIPAAFLCAGGGRIYVQTNLGGIAALTESTGEVLWITDYYRLMSHPVRPRPVAPAEVMSLPVLRGDTLWCLPKDSGLLLALDAETGALRSPPREIDGAHTLMGLLGEELILLAERRNVQWLVAVPLAPKDPKQERPSIRMQPPLAGRGFLTSTFAYIPTAKELYRFDLKTWKAKSYDVWPKETCGHVLVAGETVISIGKRITGLCAEESYRQRFHDKFEAGLPEPFIDRGRHYWESGLMTDAARDLERALAFSVLRGSRIEAPPAAEVRASLASLYLEWGQKKLGEKDEDAAASCFAWSAARQDDLELRVIPLLALADLHAKARRWSHFVGCLSRILAESPDAPTEPEQGLSVRAGALATGRLIGLRAAIGDGPFAAYDADAEAAAEAAGKLPGEAANAAWKAILSRYPSAPAAAKAEEALAKGAGDGVGKLARLLESADRAAGQPRGAEALARLATEALGEDDAGLAGWALLAMESGYEGKQALPPDCGAATVAEFVKKGRAQVPFPAATPAIPFPPKKGNETVLPAGTMDESTEAVALPMVTPVRVDWQGQLAGGRLPYELRNFAGFLEARTPGTDEVAWKVVDDRGWLGVVMQNENGRVLLSQVIDGEPAAKGGLQTGDLVEAVDGIDVQQMDHVIQLIAARADRPTVFRILRAGEEQELTLTLGNRGLRRGERVDQALATPTGRLVLRRARRMQVGDPRDGTILWSYPLPGGEKPKERHFSNLNGCWSSWGRVYVLATASTGSRPQPPATVRLACLDEATGRTIWQREFDTQVAAMVPVGADLVGVRSGNEQLLLVDARTGETRGEPVRLLANQSGFGIAAASDGRLLYCVTATGSLKALDPAHGREVWTQKVAGLGAGSLFDLAVGEGMVFLARAGRGIEAFDLVTGERRGEGKKMDGAGGAFLTISPGPIALATWPAGDGWQLSALDLSKTPPTSWEIHFTGAQELTVGHVDGEHVFLRLALKPDAVKPPAPSNLVVGVGRTSGKREWEEGIPDGRGAPRVAGQGGRLFVSLDDRMTIYGK